MVGMCVCPCRSVCVICDMGNMTWDWAIIILCYDGLLHEHTTLSTRIFSFTMGNVSATSENPSRSTLLSHVQ